MADKSAKSHTHNSNRERPRKAPGDRKVAFKSVLDNPFRIRWPSVPVNLQNVILSHLTSLLEGASNYHEAQCRASRKRKRELETEGTTKKGKRAKLAEDDVMKAPSAEPHTIPLEGNLPTKPDILNHLTCGVNAVTKRLEEQARQVRRNVVMTSKTDMEPITPISLVFVCRADVDPPILIDHFPPLVAACNSVHTNHHVKLIPLPKESENLLAEKLGIKRVSVIALDTTFAGLEELNTRLESITPLTAPWLAMQAKTATIVPTHVKQVRTSAPKDIKAAKEARMQGKLAAQQKKEKRRKAVEPTSTVSS
ncbi:hypothetical protein D9611_005650 [Ephemerocybe angulata]|uniref:Uncharacterized protein n=1 Tax=Ephemerocybe angulata TaxID=980116 RepID=A0A8H5F505_9AGAR|nr:hypothetical protein D9611_005650 [Tulosesus angulatus]